jgi:predicted phage baseplate assembly protein
MTDKKCGCTAPSCGCCEGVQKHTPVPTENRPGLEALLYRVGTHGAFLETMKARLGSMVVEAEGADGQTIETFHPLRKLTTRDASDPSIALLDGWATVADVLTFYQERIANEGYLRTATERRSILELAHLIGYTLRPGVSATVYLAYTLEDPQVLPVEIEAGALAQSVPGPGELPQSFETSESLTAQREWNNLQVRLTQPQLITLDNALLVEKMYVAGINTNLRTGDTLLLVFNESGADSVIRRVASIETQFEDNRTEIRLQPLTPDLAATVPLLVDFVHQLETMAQSGSSAFLTQVINSSEALLDQIRLGVGPSPDNWQQFIPRISNTAGAPPALVQAVDDFHESIDEALKNPDQGAPITATDPSEFITSLLLPPVPQAASSLQLGRSVTATFQDGTDAPAQLLVNFAPELKKSFYTAWANANLNATPHELLAVHVLRLQAPLFGAGVADQPTYYPADVFENDQIVHAKGELKTQDQWLKWPLQGESADALFLDQSYEAVLPLSYVMVQTPGEAVVRQVVQAQTVQRNAYGISGKTTRLRLNDGWWEPGEESNISETLRHTIVLGQSEKLSLVEEPITDPVEVTEPTMSTGIVLDGLYKEFPSGRWIILSGERADIPNVSGVKGVELLMVSGLKHINPAVSTDKIHTALLLATPTAYAYKRDTLTIYGNVVKATHGETTKEPLGSGDGSQSMQSFVLKQQPLTFTPAPNAAGVESTLKVYVNDVQWRETANLVFSGPKDRTFATKTDDAGSTTVIFGNGIQGARLPTGVLNVNSVYRKGMGKTGNVLAEQVSLLQTKPLGVKSVINPLRASGGADKEDRDQARENAPLAVMALDRLVSLQDYTDFTRTFAGIAKASARRLTDGSRQFVHVTIAGVDDIPIDPVSDLYRNLLLALQSLGDESVAVKIDSRELIILVLGVNIRLNPDYLWDPVAFAIRTVLFDTFGFRKRALAQPVLLCEIIACIQAVPGVAYVDVDIFGGVPEKVTGTDGTRRVQTLEEIAATVQQIVNTSGAANSFQMVIANQAEAEDGRVRPAQLAIFTPDIPDTIVLNQIK